MSCVFVVKSEVSYTKSKYGFGLIDIWLMHKPSFSDSILLLFSSGYVQLAEQKQLS